MQLVHGSTVSQGKWMVLNVNTVKLEISERTAPTTNFSKVNTKVWMWSSYSSAEHTLLTGASWQFWIFFSRSWWNPLSVTNVSQVSVFVYALTTPKHWGLKPWVRSPYSNRPVKYGGSRRARTLYFEMEFRYGCVADTARISWQCYHLSMNYRRNIPSEEKID